MAIKKDFIQFEQVVARGCGLDVHGETIVATIQGKGIKTETKSFKSFTSSLIKLKEWLKKQGITHISMESTGVYWKPVYNVLGDDFQILLVNARHVKNVPGHKTDKRDSRWLAKLLLSGLLRGSYIPCREIRELRDLTRYKAKLTNQVSAEKNRFQKILEDANKKLSVVFSDVFGVSSQKIIAEIVKGDYQPERLLQYVHGRVKASKEDIKDALKGYLTDHHRFMMRTIMGNIEKIESTITELDMQIVKKTEKYKDILDLLETIPGVGYDGAVCIVAEIGADMNVFASEKHLASWAGVSPGSNESAGKNKSGRITYGNKFLRVFLVQMAWAASRTKKHLPQFKIQKPCWAKG